MLRNCVETMEIKWEVWERDWLNRKAITSLRRRMRRSKVFDEDLMNTVLEMEWTWKDKDWIDVIMR
jgi:hypothetical protein